MTPSPTKPPMATTFDGEQNQSRRCAAGTRAGTSGTRIDGKAWPGAPVKDGRQPGPPSATAERPLRANGRVGAFRPGLRPTSTTAYCRTGNPSFPAEARARLARHPRRAAARPERPPPGVHERHDGSAPRDQDFPLLLFLGWKKRTTSTPGGGFRAPAAGRRSFPLDSTYRAAGSEKPGIPLAPTVSRRACPRRRNPVPR